MSTPSERAGGPGSFGRRGPWSANHGVAIIDTPALRVHHPGDLVNLALSLAGIALTLAVAVYAQGTTSGLTEDVQGIASAVRTLLVIPVAVLEGLITFIAPIAVLTELVVRRHVRRALEALTGGILALALVYLATVLVEEFATDQLRWSLSVVSRGELVVTIPLLMAGTAGLITTAGLRGRRRSIAWSWNALWVGLGVGVITGLVTLPGALLTVLIGRVAGLTVRYAFGVESERAYGASLVAGIRRAGFDPQRLVRVADVAAEHPHGDEALATDLATVALTRYGANRVYAMRVMDGTRYDVVVLDGDRQVVGVLARLWRSLRLRGIDGRTVVSLRQVAERTALLTYAAHAAGVCTPRLLALAEADDSMLLVHAHATGAVPLRDLPPEQVTDDVLHAVWEQLQIAHGAGIAHRALTADVVLVDPTGAACPERGPDRAPTAILTGWEQGDVASSELARRIDISQMLAVLALKVGAERTIASASHVLPDADLASIGPLLQTIALPSTTREEARRQKDAIPQLRNALLATLPEADVAPERLTRFGLRTVLTLALTIAVVTIVVTTINFAEIQAAIASASPWWALTAFVLGMLTFLGAAIALRAFSPVPLPPWRTVLIQSAATFIALVAPAGVGPAVLNHRMIVRRGASNALAAASVALTQISQVLMTIVLLVAISLFTGASSALQVPSGTVIAAAAAVVIVAGGAMAIPPVRRWVLARIGPMWRQTWPRLVQMFSQPRRFAVAALGNLLVTACYLGAFWASLQAFGRDLPLIDLALIYLLGNTAGALVPTPGGLGSVEGALIGALVATGGVPLAIATSVVVLFRGLTFWARIPFGWLSMRILQRQGEL